MAIKTRCAADLSEGERVRCAEPDCWAIVTRVERINLYVSYGSPGPDAPKPAPAVRVHLRFADGPRAGDLDACNHHPKDKVRLE